MGDGRAAGDVPELQHRADELRQRPPGREAGLEPEARRELADARQRARGAVLEQEEPLAVGGRQPPVAGVALDVGERPRAGRVVGEHDVGRRTLRCRAAGIEHGLDVRHGRGLEALDRDGEARDVEGPAHSPNADRIDWAEAAAPRYGDRPSSSSVVRSSE